MNGLSLEFKWNHRTTTISLVPKLFYPSLYRYPFISVRFLFVWITHDWNPIGVTLNQPAKVQRIK